MPCYAIDGVIPVVDPTAFVHPSAVLIGDVWVGAGCYVGPAACLRGDFGRIVLKAGSNVQDTCVIHGGEVDTVVEEDGHIGHGAVLHNCIVGRNSLVGMNAVVLDGTVIGEECLVAAMALVKGGTVVPPRTLLAGNPARPVRPMSDQDVARKAAGTALYQELARRCRKSLVEVSPLPAPEVDRKRLPSLDLPKKR